jgi:hypothetical protein
MVKKAIATAPTATLSRKNPRDLAQTPRRRAK